MTVEHVRRLVAVWAHRTLVLGARDEVAYVYAFENRGEQIGVTLNHPHGQIYAYPTDPADPRARDRQRALASRANRRLPVVRLNRRRLADGRRVVARGGGWLATVPFFARWPYEVHLTSERHVGWLHELAATRWTVSRACC